SMRYHQARARFFSMVHSSILFAVFAVSTTGAVLLLNALPGKLVGVGVLTAISLLAWLSLVWNPVEKAHLHKSLCRDFTMLTGKIHSNANPDEATRAEWTRDIHALYAQEPPVFRALHAHCANQIAIALNAESGYFVDLKLRHRLFRNLCPFQGSDFKNRAQMQAHQ
ncbi:MAG: hypothetical protein OD918_00350, partial [Gammaproteobacteria bacterium]